MTRAGRWITGSIGALVVLVIIGGAAWYSYEAGRRTQPAPTPSPTTPAEPKQPATEQPSSSTKTEFSSRRGVVIKLDTPLENHVVTSPLTVTGQVPGNWSFEASFPVMLRTADGTVLAQAPAHLTGDWMTTDYVPFTVTLEFTTSATTGELVLKKDNPSGLADKDDEVTIPVQFTK